MFSSKQWRDRSLCALYVFRRFISAPFLLFIDPTLSFFLHSTLKRLPCCRSYSLCVNFFVSLKTENCDDEKKRRDLPPNVESFAPTSNGLFLFVCFFKSRFTPLEQNAEQKREKKLTFRCWHLCVSFIIHLFCFAPLLLCLDRLGTQSAQAKMEPLAIYFSGWCVRHTHTHKGKKTRRLNVSCCALYFCPCLSFFFSFLFAFIG